ncbi:MAG: uracil-DNA glycosylase [Halobacteriales archaeon]|nr:uracil-DNA glycosylase [Halobacteriales archaeon]
MDPSSDRNDVDERMEGLTVAACQRCPALVESRSRIVNGVGDPDAELLFVGEGPGEQEDTEGEPFVGRSGSVLTDTLQEQGLARSDVRITNCVRCRPPDNRDPSDDELRNCRPYLEAEIERIDPTAIIALGKVPSEHLLGRSVGVTNEAGTIETVEIAGYQRDVLISVHPAASLYDPSQRTTFEQVIEKAASMVGSGDQSTLGQF